MPISVDYASSEFVTEILAAANQEHVKNITTLFIDRFQIDPDKDIVQTFIINELIKLDSFNVFNKTAQQWSNIKMARILLNRQKNKNIRQSTP